MIGGTCDSALALAHGAGLSVLG